jgi:hypothetical protein
MVEMGKMATRVIREHEWKGNSEIRMRGRLNGGNGEDDNQSNKGA